MAKELISKRTRRELQEYFVGTTLRTISQAFEDAEIECDETFLPTDRGQRRCLVQQYYASMDFTKWDDVRKFVTVYAGALMDLEHGFENAYNGDYLKNTFARLSACIRHDGFEYRDGNLVASNIVPATSRLRDDAIRVDAPYMVQQLDRIENQIESDPRLAIGTSKELVETVCKMILADRKVKYDRKWELMDLVKRTREELKLVPDDIPESARLAKRSVNFFLISPQLPRASRNFGIRMEPATVTMAE